MAHGTSTFGLLAKRRFGFLFATQFLGAFNDNLFKSALTILIAFRLVEGEAGALLVTLAAGLFVLPFFLFSAHAGLLADKCQRSVMTRWIKGVEVGVMAFGAWAILAGSVPAMLALVFLMGAQSTYFGPIKYGLLPDHLGEDELLGGNALIEAGTFLSILLGTIAGGLVLVVPGGESWAAIGVVAVAVVGFALSFGIPDAPVRSPGLRVGFNLWAQTRDVVRHARSSRNAFLAILGISWFWFTGATFLSQFPAFVRDVLGGDETVVTLLLVCFSVGVGLGSLGCNRLLGGKVSARYVPAAAIAITAFTVDLYLASSGRVPAAGAVSAQAFLADPANWRVMADLLAIAVSGGMFVVPLYAILQTTSEPEHRSRDIAANNVVNSAFTVASALLCLALLAVGLSVPEIFLAQGIANAAVALFVCLLLPETLLKGALRLALRTLFRVEVRGLDHVPADGRAIYVANHLSFLDAPMLAAFLPGKPAFAVNTHIAKRWWVRPALQLVNAVTVDPTSPMATKTLIKVVRGGERLAIFPEGRITTTGSLMKVYEGPGLIADKSDAPIVPIHIEGLQRSKTSRMHGKMRLSWFPKVTITVHPPVRPRIEAGLVGARRRQRMGVWLQDLMTEIAFRSTDLDRTLFDAVVDARDLFGPEREALVDQNFQPLTAARLVLGSLVLGRRLSRLARRGEAVGVLLPNSVGAAVTFFALQSRGLVPAMLNFTAGGDGMAQAARAAEVGTVLTSRLFVERAKLQGAVTHLERSCRIVWLEDVRGGIGLLDKLLDVLAARFRALRPASPAADDAAVILFTSGSEGAPKGVVLSHRNILANCAQIASRIAFNPTDKVMNAMPVFHSFGLTGGLVLPVLSGVKVFMYPSPLHYKIIPELCYGENATILFATDTFLAGYARKAHPYDFYSLRMVVAGAERVRDETRQTWTDKFGLRILEGYGATECSPVVAVNTPMHFKAGTVGRTLPGIETRVEPVPGIEGAGRLWVRGPSVMKGYMRVERPGVVQPLDDGWYDTGDIVAVDEQGFVAIRGRAKRFAKVGGEMVSLAAAEAAASAVWPEAAHAVVALPDPRKGEQLALLTTRPGAGRRELLEFAKARGIAEIALPRLVIVVAEVPLLGTGKTDYVRAQALAAELASGAAVPAD
ncbi:acyl-[ACP]--phospholipid O-acyltransferase [Arenibaculum sp.]|uniref:acyl-[ACP]--phospholipid O-acyltransferase n=1 Tax=Arenibaculum sp. TaxID=2865862 RepID=UPI002E167746|nr:acyl-[ACP]--phospholipid O-acyltransferase [Arenibaculum sp.]